MCVIWLLVSTINATLVNAYLKKKLNLKTYGYDKVPEIEGLEKAELQLNFLHKYNKNPINLMYDEKDWVKKIKKDIDNMFDADFVKKNYEKVNSNYKQSNHFVKRIFIS